MKKIIKIEQITCPCGQVVAGCVNGQQDVRWNQFKEFYIKNGCTIKIVLVEDFVFGDCICKDITPKKMFKILAEPNNNITLFKH